MEKMNFKARRYFAGANTKYGFHNLFSEINRSDKDGFLYILKGGPGTGKSTLMKKIGKAFEGRAEIEYFYCSSDHESLDGIRLPAINTAVVDGTAPHVTETIIPGAREKIVDLGAFIGGGIKKHEQEITALIKQKKQFFQQAYLYIKNASNLFDCNNLIFSSFYKDAPAAAARYTRKIFKECITDKLKCVTDKLNGKNRITGKPYDGIETDSADISGKYCNKNKAATQGKPVCSKNETTQKGAIRKLFLSAVAGKDIVDFTPYNNYSEIIELEHDPYLSGLILSALADTAIRRGFDATCFCEPLSPEAISSVYIPDADVLIKRKSEAELVLKAKAQANAIEYNITATNDTVAAACHALTSAKNTHKQIEEFYIPAMDFSGADKLTQTIIAEIEQKLFN